MDPELREFVDHMRTRLPVFDEMQKRLPVFDEMQKRLPIIDEMQKRLPVIDEMQKRLPIIDEMQKRLPVIDEMQKRLGVVERRLDGIDEIEHRLVHMEGAYTRLEQRMEATEHRLVARIDAQGREFREALANAVTRLEEKLTARKEDEDAPFMDVSRLRRRTALLERRVLRLEKAKK